MAKKTKKEIKSLYESALSSKTAKEVKEHYQESWEYVVQPNLDDWDEKESMLLGKPLDEYSTESKSQVFDPRLSTIVIERTARVMAQNPAGRALAMSKDDRGKNMLMNLLTDKWIIPNANSQFDYLIKNRLWDMYSMIYGVMFKLVDYVIHDDYECPDSFILPIRDCSPQPGRFSIKDSDWFGVSSWVTPEWFKSRNKETWKNIDSLLLSIKEGKASAKGESEYNRRSYIEQQRQPSPKNDSKNEYKRIELFTEYRRDRWVTIVPDFPEIGVLRDIANPHDNNELPIVSKYCFPLLDSIYGLGEFERGKTLQFAINSLINMYLDGVKFSIFPPVMIDPDGVVPSSLVNEPAAKWLRTKPNAIEPVNLSPQGLNTFQATYSFLIASLMNQAGTTDTNVAEGIDPSQGKTPQALKMVSSRENARDSWDRFMMEKALEEEMNKYVNLVSRKQDKEIELRLFSKEIEEIAKVYPDVIEYTEGDERAKVKVSSKYFKDTKFDYQIVSGSTYRVDQEKELQNTQNLLNLALDPQKGQILMQSLQQKGKTLDIAELFQRSVVASGMQDWDKIIVDLPEQPIQGQQAPTDMMDQTGGGIPQMQGNPGMGMPDMDMPPMEQATPQMQQFQHQEYSDPEITEFAKQILR